MKRRNWIRQASLTTGAVLAAVPVLSRGLFPNLKPVSGLTPSGSPPVGKPVLTIAHITDVHIRPDENVPERFKKCLREVTKHPVDFFLNGGDSIHDASYKDVKRERVTDQWGAWDECMKLLSPYEVYSCLGNHDMWWAAPSKEDDMYGKEYAVKRLRMPHRYYSFSKKGWHFIMLDSMGGNSYSVDEEQFAWLERELDDLPAGTPVLLMSHCPILGVTGHFYPHDQHADFRRLKDLFYKHKDKVRVCLSGHMHLLDDVVYNGVRYFCNGAMSGYWWGRGNEESAGPGYYHETPPGYSIITLYDNGEVENNYHTHNY